MAMMDSVVYEVTDNESDEGYVEVKRKIGHSSKRPHVNKKQNEDAEWNDSQSFVFIKNNLILF